VKELTPARSLLVGLWTVWASRMANEVGCFEGEKLVWLGRTVEGERGLCLNYIVDVPPLVVGEIIALRKDLEAFGKISFSRVLKDRDSVSARAKTVLSFDVGTMKGFFDDEFAKVPASISFNVTGSGKPLTSLPTSA
jgi:hypothetical protein